MGYHFFTDINKKIFILYSHIFLIMQNCTDPTTGYAFRSLKSALSYLQTGKVPARATIPKRSVHDLYSFDKSADLVIIIIVRSYVFI